MALVINLHHPPSEEPFDAAKTLGSLCQFAHSILLEDSDNSNEAYKTCLYWCRTADNPAEAWPRLREILLERTKLRIEVLNGAQKLSPDTFLNLVHKEWDSHVRTLRRLAEVFAHLDCTVIGRSEVRSIESAGHAMLGEALRNNPPVWAFLLNSFLYSLKQFREGNSDSKLLLKGLAKLFINIDKGDMLLDRVTSDMDHYYRKLALTIKQSSIDEILMINYKSLKIELVISLELFGLKSAKKFHLIVINRLFYDLLKLLLKPGDLTTETIVPDELLLKLMGEITEKSLKLFGVLTLAAPTDDILTLLSNAFARLIVYQGRQVMKKRILDEKFISTLERPLAEGEGSITELTSIVIIPIVRCINDWEAMIEEILSLYEKHRLIVQDIFENHHIFQEAIKSAWRLLVSSHTSVGGVLAVVLAQYIDRLFRRYARTSDADWDKIFELPYCLFSFLQCKDFFIEFYRKDLVTRLLTGRGPSSEIELLFVKRMKEDCGSCFTEKIERTFAELKASRREWRNFMISTNLKQICPNISFQVHCLHDSVWPLRLVMEQEEGKSKGRTGSRLTGVTWPAECIKLQKTFESFFKSQHPMRHLSWEWSVGSFTLTGLFNKKKIEILCSPPQALCLLLFNDKTKLTAKEVEAMLNLPSRTVESALMSLCTVPERRIVVKEGCDYRINDEFDSTEKRVVLPQLSLRETQESLTRVDAAISADRSYYVDALAVRTLKRVRSMKETELIQTIVHDGRFAVTWQFVVDRLEALVERAYIKRSGDNFVYNDN